MREQSLRFLEALINAPSPSGFEHEVAKLYRDYAREHVDDIKTDVHGNVSAILNPEAPMRIMLAGHMDEIGFIIHHISEEGLLHFSTIGGHDSAIPVGQTVWVHGKRRIPGAIGRKAIHLLGPDELKSKPKISEMWIDIGAASRAEAEEVVRLGDVATFQHDFQQLLGDRAVARAFDNKAGLFIVAEAMRLLKQEGGLRPGVGVYGLGTVQEEIGSRGAQTSATWIKPQTGIAVDMEHAIDYPGVSPAEYGRLDVGKGPSILRGANTNPVVFDLLCRSAREDDIPHQIRIAPGSTPTDANAMQINGAGMATALVGIPLRYMHTPCEVLSLTDLENAARLLAAYCRRITPETDFTPW
ncbi:M42 family metallopeptidase [Roseomonas sp. SSH11]|uniref:M42 family metallopeptidase n=1 Tax=Pararoseomonas baculiformis TaxID=2820812 RepID=A0ABS4A8P8_9PROT|nr:M42 family metallopeptidase [Pararoseomonas baculiformis]MBP0443371.1 M42 family metallopeptidase [Pararoseomonas baculiformis]